MIPFPFEPDRERHLPGAVDGHSGPRDRTLDVPDDSKTQAVSHSNYINVEVREELAYWSSKLGVSRYHLKKVVDRVGPHLPDIYYALGLREWEFPKRGKDA